MTTEPLFMWEISGMSDELRTYGEEDEVELCAWCRRPLGGKSFKSKLNSKTYCSQDCETAGETTLAGVFAVFIATTLVIIVAVILFYSSFLESYPDGWLVLLLAFIGLPFFCHAFIKGRKLRETIVRVDSRY
jgi:hypothetical protein